MKTASRLLTVALLLCSTPLAFAQGFTNLDDEGEAGGYDVTAQLNKIPVEWNLNAQENGDAYRLRLTPAGAELSVVAGGKSTPLATEKTPVTTGSLVIQRRGPRWAVLSGNRVVLQAEDDRWMEGAVGYRGGEVTTPRLQPVEEITFDDDFMRVATEVAITEAIRANPKNGLKISDAKIGEETIWTVAEGSWATTGITEQDQAQVAQSANPFAFSSKNKGTNLALAGRPFWSDYSVEAAIKPYNASAVGLALYVQDNKNYLLFEWQRNGALQLRSVVDGVSRIIVAAQSEGFDEKNWYRLKFTANGGVLRALIDESEVMRARTDLFGRGLVGLYAVNAEEDATGNKEKTAVFDDLKVRSALDFHDNFSHPVPGRWQTVSGAWTFNNSATPANANGAFAIMGEADWHDYTVSGHITMPADAVAGLVAHHLKGQGAYIFRIAGSKSTLPYAGKAQMLKIQDGKSTILTEATIGNRFDQSAGTWNFSMERGYLQGSVEIDGKVTRVLDAWSDSNEGGRAGIYAQRGTGGAPVIKDFAVEFPRQKSVWAAVPDIYVDPKQAETMGGWSTPEGSWLPVQPIKNNITLPAAATAADAKVFWHKGAFWGDQDIRFKFPELKAGQSLILMLGRVDPKQAATAPPLVLTLKNDGTNLLATLSRGESEKIKDATHKIEGELTGQPIELSRRGNYVVVRLGDEDAQSTLLAANVAG